MFIYKGEKNTSIVKKFQRYLPPTYNLSSIYIVDFVGIQSISNFSIQYYFPTRKYSYIPGGTALPRKTFSPLIGIEENDPQNQVYLQLP